MSLGVFPTYLYGRRFLSSFLRCVPKYYSHIAITDQCWRIQFFGHNCQYWRAQFAGFCPTIRRDNFCGCMSRWSPPFRYIINDRGGGGVISTGFRQQTHGRSTWSSLSAIYLCFCFFAFGDLQIKWRDEFFWFSAFIILEWSWNCLILGLRPPIGWLWSVLRTAAYWLVINRLRYHSATGLMPRKRLKCSSFTEILRFLLLE